MYLTPKLYATGKWVLKDPFTTVVDAVYTCTSIRSINQIVEDGVDPFVTYYEPLGIPLATFETDKLNYGSIVTLASSDAVTIDVPDSFIDSYPDASNVPYRHIVLSTSLGGIADTVPLEDIQVKVQELILNELGIETTVKVHQSGEVTEYVDLQTHKVIEANRLSRLVDNDSLYALVAKKEAEILSLIERNKLLEDTIKASGLI